ncbi:hypothetical protein, partial [Aeromonas sp. Prich7-2]|uniref:hypothetical protein n=1 Tax=Aeromonas sp. Prich7-2 TaxID=2823361 RepID=UPI001B31C764
YNLARRRQYQYDARRQQGDGGGVFGDSQFTSTLSVNFHFPKIPRRTFFLWRRQPEPWPWRRFQIPAPLFFVLIRA